MKTQTRQFSTSRTEVAKILFVATIFQAAFFLQSDFAFAQASTQVSPLDVEVEAPVQTSNKEPVPHIQKKGENFDAHDYPQNRFIEHPNAAKGLYLIDKNKIYYYRTNEADSKHEAAIRLGPYTPSNLANPKYPEITFDSVYTTHNIPLILYDIETDIFKKFGRFGYKFGTGLYVAQGSGAFVNAYAQAAEPRGPPERFTLFVLPCNAGVIYHLEYLKHQWVIPYGEAGVDAFLFAESRNDNVNKLGAAFGAAPAAHVSGGVTIPIGHDARSFLDLSREYGINRFSIAIEFRDYVALSKKFDFSGSTITGGFSAEY